MVAGAPVDSQGVTWEAIDDKHILEDHIFTIFFAHNSGKDVSGPIRATAN